MKSLLNAICDGLTFTDIAGKRHPRIYVVFTGLILLLLAILAACTALEHKTMMDEVQSMPLAVEIANTPVITSEPAQATAEACPNDPADWIFQDTLPGDNFKRIEPACVYQGLSKPVAWALAIRSGYTRAEASDALGYTAFPIRRLNEVMALTNTKGPLPLSVSFTPPHPDFAEWRIRSDGRLALVYALRGCFRTYEIVGNQARYWNEDYPVVCVLSEDFAGSHTVFKLDNHLFTSAAVSTRTFALFGYAGNGQWVWLGTQKEPKVSLDAILNFFDEARLSAEMHGLPVWDAAWLAEVHGLHPKPLPDNWQTMTDDIAKQAILNELNSYVETLP